MSNFRSKGLIQINRLTYRLQYQVTVTTGSLLVVR